MQFSFWNRRDPDDETGTGLIAALVDNGSKCVLTTRTRFGEPRARKVRVSNYSTRHKPTLMFVVPKDAELAADLANDATVTLSVMDPRSGRLVHVEGRGALFEGQHSPVHLDASVRSPRLKVIAGEVDFMVLRVELPLVDGHMPETQPPFDVDVGLLAPQQRGGSGGAGSFLRGLLS